MHQWQLWSRSNTILQVEGVRPYLDSWNAGTDSAQIRLQTYLQELKSALGPLPIGRNDLFLHMDVDLRDPKRLKRGYDLENYLKPVVGYLGPQRFVMASATKRAETHYGTRANDLEPVATVSIGIAESAGENATMCGWEHTSCRPGSGNQKPAWKERIWQSLRAASLRPMSPGDVDVHLAWHCSSGQNWYQPRNWSTLWKPTGDAMGPILGPVHAQDPSNRSRFNPDDHRIVSLGLHLNVDEEMDYDVEVGM